MLFIIMGWNIKALDSLNHNYDNWISSKAVETRSATGVQSCAVK